MPETIYNNRYRLDAKVGEGGMAVVYRGYDLLLRRQVAVKVLRPQFAADDEFVQRFYQEAQAAAKLSHPNIVNTYDVGEVGDSHYIVQEFVGGETLAALIARERRLPESAAIRYAMQICAALSAAHRGELLHRDIKPSNILITSEDVVRVADFGIARAANAQTVTSKENVLASVPYGAPEHLTGQQLSEASDLYSVGVVLYEMVTGKRPYDAETAMGVAMAHVNAPVPDPTSAGVAVSPQLRDVIMRLLRKSPKERFQTAGEALVALRACLGSAGSADGARDRETDTAVIRRKNAAAEARRRWFTALDDASPADWSPRRVITAASTVVVLILLIVIGLAIHKTVADSPHVPDLGGKTAADAVAALHAAGIDDVQIKPREDAAVPAGLVSTTDPAAGAAVKSSDVVTVYVSAGPPTLGLPSVLGQDVKSATTFLTQKGFAVRVGAPVHSGSVPKGYIAKTNPGPGAKVAQHGVVVLFPSGGPVAVTVPNVVDLSDADARAALAKAGLTLRVSQVVPNVNIPPQTVMDQEPNGGAQAAPGSTVVVEESGGPNAVTVPNVVGGTVDDARNGLAQAGLAVGTIAQVMDASTSPGTVVSQNPQAGAQTGAGTAVDLYVAVAPAGAPGTTTAPGPATPNALPPIPNVVGMTVDDAKAALAKAGYTVAQVTVLPNRPPDAKVVNTEPEPGATTPPGTVKVNLIVGPPAH